MVWRRLAGAALVLLAAVSFAIGPARAQTTTTEAEIWSGTVTTGPGAIYDASTSDGSNQGSLDRKNFAYGGKIYEVLYFSGGQFSWKPYEVIASGTFAVYADSHRHEFNGADEKGGPVSRLGILWPGFTPAANQSYALRLVRVIGNTDANLLGLALQAPDGSQVPLSADFAPATTQYTADLLLNVDFVTVLASGASVSILPPDDDAGLPGHQLRFTPGQSRRIDVAVTAGNGTTMKSYRIDATRLETDVCQRTAAVRDAIVGALAGVDDCTDVSAAQLRGIRKVPAAEDDDLKAPPSGAATSPGCQVWRYSSWQPKSAETLPVGLFDGLTGLKRLEIVSAPELTRLPRRLFAGLSSLESLDIWFNPKLSTLPVGLFDGLERLNGCKFRKILRWQGCRPGCSATFRR